MGGESPRFRYGSATVRSLIASLFLILTSSLFSTTSAWSADFDNRLAAYQKGDYATALKCYSFAAEQGVALAQTLLGAMYYNGAGLIQDDVYSHVCWDIAASQADEDAANNREGVAKIMRSLK